MSNPRPWPDHSYPRSTPVPVCGLDRFTAYIKATESHPTWIGPIPESLRTYKPQPLGPDEVRIPWREARKFLML